MHDFSAQRKPFKTQTNQDNVEMIRFILRRNGTRGRYLLNSGLDVIGLGGPELGKYFNLHKSLLGRTGQISSYETNLETYQSQMTQLAGFEPDQRRRINLFHRNILEHIKNELLYSRLKPAILLDLDFCRMFDSDWQGNDQAFHTLWSILAAKQTEWVFISVTHCARNERDLFRTEEKIRDLVLPWIDLGFNPEINTVCRYKDPWSPTMLNGFIALRNRMETDETILGRDGTKDSTGGETTRTEKGTDCSAEVSNLG